MKLPTYDIKAMQEPRFKIEKIRGASLIEMVRDVERRVAAGGTLYSLAVVQKNTGMVLLRDGAKPNTFEGLLYPLGTCGSESPATWATAGALAALGASPISDRNAAVRRLCEDFLWAYPHVRVLALGTDNVICEAI